MYLVKWKVTKTIPTECPDYRPDPYTGEYPSFHCGVYHCETVTEKRSTEFKTRKEAQDFIRNAPQICEDFRIIKEKRKE